MKECNKEIVPLCLCNQSLQEISAFNLKLVRGKQKTKTKNTTPALGASTVISALSRHPSTTQTITSIKERKAKVKDDRG